MTRLNRFLLWASPVAVGLIALAWQPVFNGPPWTHEIRSGGLILVAIPVLTVAIATAAIEPVRKDWQRGLVAATGGLLLFAVALAYASFAAQDPKHPYADHTIARTSYIVLAASLLIGVGSVAFAKPRPGN